MMVLIAMLRGINLAKHNRIKMEELRDLFHSLGMVEPRTHIQSGNVVFSTTRKDLSALSKLLSSNIEQRFNVRSEVILRTAAELRDAIARNPFAARTDVPPDRLLINFLAHDPGPEAQKNLSQLQAAPDEFILDGRELYIAYAAGVSKAKISPAAIDRAILKTPGTARNLNTVRKLLEIAEGVTSAK